MSGLNNCASCDHKIGNSDGGWCYMFKVEPAGACGQYRPIRVSPLLREAAPTTPAAHPLAPAVVITGGSGPRVTVAGVEVASWFGSRYEPDAKGLAANINRALDAWVRAAVAQAAPSADAAGELPPLPAPAHGYAGVMVGGDQHEAGNFSASQMRQQFNAGREFEAERQAALRAVGAGEALTEDQITQVCHALVRARDGLMSERATGLAVTEPWREATLPMVEQALRTMSFARAARARAAEGAAPPTHPGPITLIESDNEGGEPV